MTFKVKGRGSFPFDMLRFDACYPASEGDSHILERITRNRPPHDEAVITLKKADPTRMPTKARWESFGWTVVDG